MTKIEVGKTYRFILDIGFESKLRGKPNVYVAFRDRSLFTPHKPSLCHIRNCLNVESKYFIHFIGKVIEIVETGGKDKIIVLEKQSLKML
jgi:hypothetical protein